MGKSNEKETVAAGKVEIWDFENKFGMPHPIHLHGTPFRILDRTAGEFPGLISRGWKDTVLILGREKVRIAKNFGYYKGQFMYHCHNLEHEDMGMMREFRVK